MAEPGIPVTPSLPGPRPGLAVAALVLAVIALLAGLAAGGLVLWDRVVSRSRDSEASQSPWGKVATATTRDIAWRVTATGVLEYGPTVPLVARSGGRLAEWAVAPGGRVEPGTAVARVADPGAAFRVEAARLRLERAEISYAQLLAGPAGSPVLAAREAAVDLALAEAGLARLEARAAGLQVRAPAAGRLTGIAVTPGQRASEGQLLGWIEPGGPSRVVFPLEQYWVGSLAPGSAATVIAPAPGGPRVLEGTVVAVAPELGPVPGSAAAEVTLTVEGPPLVPGLSVHVVLVWGDESIQAAGSVVPARRIPVRAAAGGTLLTWLVDSGTPVEAGTPVARLEDPDLALRLESARQARDAAAEAAAAAAATLGLPAGAADDPALVRAALAVADARAALDALLAAGRGPVVWTGPAPGVLVEQRLQPGDPVAPGEVLGAVTAGTGPPTVVADVDPAVYHAVPPGVPVTLRFAALPDVEVDGAVVAREPYRVRVGLDPADPGAARIAEAALPPGAGVRVEIVAASFTQVLAVPEEAIDRRGPVPAVWVVRGDTVIPVAVVVGPSDGEWVRISSATTPGLISPGDQVLLVGDGP